MGLHGRDFDEACLHCKGYPHKRYPQCTCTVDVLLRRMERGRTDFPSAMSLSAKCPDTIPPWMTLAGDDTFRLCRGCSERVQDCTCTE